MSYDSTLPVQQYHVQKITIQMWSDQQRYIVNIWVGGTSSTLGWYLWLKWLQVTHVDFLILFTNMPYKVHVYDVRRLFKVQ